MKHHIDLPTFRRAVEAVAGLGAVQARNDASAKWALELRSPCATTHTSKTQSSVAKKPLTKAFSTSTFQNVNVFR
jgi:hypothetical protein